MYFYNCYFFSFSPTWWNDAICGNRIEVNKICTLSLSYLFWCDLFFFGCLIQLLNNLSCSSSTRVFLLLEQICDVYTKVSECHKPDCYPIESWTSYCCCCCFFLSNNSPKCVVSLSLLFFSIFFWFEYFWFYLTISFYKKTLLFIYLFMYFSLFSGFFSFLGNFPSMWIVFQGNPTC